MSVPAPRVPWDITGSAMFLDDSAGFADELTQAQKETLNGEDDVVVQLSIVPGYLSIVFPPVTLEGWVYGVQEDQYQRNAEYSLNTTNGADGDWVGVGSDGRVEASFSAPHYRESLHEPASPIAGVQGFRFGTTQSILSPNRYSFAHLYGHSEEPDDRLEIWHPTLDEPLPGDWFDLGSYARGSGSDTVQFRVKNHSATKTAEGVEVSLGALTPGSTPSVLDWHDISDDDVTYGATLSLGNLAADTISSVMYLRRDQPSDANLGYWTARITAEATDWT